jgi:hypothetical protein
VDFEEVFALVARMESVPTILAAATHEAWCVQHLDVKSTFLNGDMEEEVYVKQPPGFSIDIVDQVLTLNKALYGLRQAPQVWYANLHMSLSLLRFMHSDHKHAVYTRRVDCRPLVVGVYVDDLLIIEPVDDNISGFKMKM